MGRPNLSLDFATSIVASGKVNVAANRQEQLALGHLVDAEGEPTTDPVPFAKEREGALLPFGLHKGSGLALMCELLGGVLSGGGTMDRFPQNRPSAVNNFIALVLDPASFRAGTGAAAEAKPSGDGAEQSLSEVPTEALEAELRRRSAASAPEAEAAREAFGAHVQEVVADFASATPLRDDHPYKGGVGSLPPVVEGLPPSVMLPGERELVAKGDREERGVLVDDGMWGEVLTAGELVGLGADYLDALVDE